MVVPVDKVTRFIIRAKVSIGEIKLIVGLLNLFANLVAIIKQLNKPIEFN